MYVADPNLTTLTSTQLCAHLEHLGFERAPAATLDGLRKLQRTHMLRVRLENLDVVARVPLRLDTSELFEKLVTRGRGGYYFELNTLYAALLRGLSFGALCPPGLAEVGALEGAVTNEDGYGLSTTDR